MLRREPARLVQLTHAARLSLRDDRERYCLRTLAPDIQSDGRADIFAAFRDGAFEAGSGVRNQKRTALP